jgi:hypothetical protein
MLSKIKKLLQFRLKRWHTAMRGWKGQDIRVIVCLEDSIWYWVILEWLAGLQQYVCHWMGYVKLPKFIRRIERVWDAEWDPEPSTWEEYYGDSLHSLWHVHVCDPIFQFVWKHKDFHKAWPQWEMTLDEARKTFAHDPEIYEWVEKEERQHRQWDAEELDEVRKAHASGELTREQALEKLGWRFEGEDLGGLLDGQPCEK